MSERVYLITTLRVSVRFKPALYGHRSLADAKRAAVRALVASAAYICVVRAAHKSASQLARRFDRVVFKRAIRIILENRGQRNIQGIKSCARDESIQLE